MVLGSIGLVVLLVTLIVWRKLENKTPVHVNGKTVGIVALGIVGSLLLGLGLSLVMVWSNIVLGIIVGIVGIIVMLSLIPLIKGLK